MFQARSTAMAMETPGFTRDDLYTLFMTARIINFLKSMSWEGSKTHLSALLDHPQALTPRQRTGMDLLRRLFEEKRLYAATSNGLKPLGRFNPGPFFDVLKKAGHIRNGSGQTISTRAD